MTEMVRIGLVGLGYWGPHFARIAWEHSGAELVWCCDRSEAALELPERRYPLVKRTASFEEVLADDSVDAVIVATPTATHAGLAVAALEAGKHVLVEKPLAASAEEVDRIEAARGDRVVMVGHTFVYNTAVAAVRELVASGELGRVQYVDSVRAALGPIRNDVNALWDLGAHDVSIFLDMLPGNPQVVTAIAQDYLREGHPDVVYFAVRFDDGVLAHSHVSWLDPYKVRRMTVVGEDRMVVFDDVAADERLKILERGASYDAPAVEARGQSYGEYRAVLREGTITIPRLPNREPLSTQFEEFLAAIHEGRVPYSGIAQGRGVVRVLEAAQRSLENGGAPETLGTVARFDAGS
jgi:predicted dehydrogenase